MTPNDLREPMLHSKPLGRERSWSRDSNLANQMLAPTGDVTHNFQQQQNMGDVLHATVLAHDHLKKGMRIITGMFGDGIVRRKDGVPARMLRHGKHGIDYIAHHKQAQHHRDKVIEYEQATVAKSPLTIARDQTAATVFDFPGVKRDCVLSLTVSFCFALLSLLFAVNDDGETALQALTDIGTVVSQGALSSERALIVLLARTHAHACVSQCVPSDTDAFSRMTC